MRGRWIAAAVAATACLATAAVWITEGSRPARPDEIRSAIAEAAPHCRALLRERLRAHIAARGAISRRTLSTTSHLECTAAGPQFDATEG